ncbi:MAG: hypothetical protein BMS9Abin08_1643 [Gammaproteobacteria bacterium]|nr:MAG: hypothetical protein BMS9Abin08_1643 [Gammaproteobacteria bacterium]
MEFYIREMPDGTATLMTRDGLYLFTFRNLDSARRACEDWYRMHGHEVGEIAAVGDGGVSCSVCS